MFCRQSSQSFQVQVKLLRPQSSENDFILSDADQELVSR